MTEHHIAEHSQPPPRASAVPGPPPPAGGMDRLLTYDELEELFACSRDHIFGLVRSKQLPVVYIGPRLPRVRYSDVQAFLAARTIPANPRPEENN